ncbi:pyochelin synthetase [Catenulispora sp. GP43]|uniref:non-ribosomal peptide synthetase n=1 Tax=Catenulispora sp. GP43 TaxID=3156263 RepID=UPI0035191BDD
MTTETDTETDTVIETDMGIETDADLAALVARLESTGVQLWEDGGQIRFRAPVGALTDQDRTTLRAHRTALAEFLRDDVSGEQLVPDPANAHAPFPLTDVQAAYLLGRSSALDYGDVGCQVYLEAEFAGLDAPRIAAAWQTLIDRHPMLRAVVDERGHQQVLSEVPRYDMPVLDLRSEAPDAAAEAVLEVRDQLCRRDYQPDHWPLFDVRASLTGTGAVLHLSFDLLIADFMSIQLLLDELYELYHTPEQPLAELEISYRDYAVAERRRRDRRGYLRARDYWRERIDTLPTAPALPTLDRPQTRGSAAFRRWQTELAPDQWSALRAHCAARGLTPSGAVLAAYAETLGRWTRQDRFCLSVTLLNRLPLHPQVEALVGDFTTVDVLEVAQDPDAAFTARARQTQAQLWADMDHLSYSGVEVLREVGRRRGRAAALMPVVFTSAIALNDEGREPRFWRDATLAAGLTQTPQVWIDCQVMVRGGALAVNWDVRDGVFPPGLVEDMFEAFEALLLRLAAEEPAWDAPAEVPLPAAQAARRRTANDTGDPEIEARTQNALLHHAILAQARSRPDQPAVVSASGTVTYGELLGRAAAVARELAGESDAPVAVVMDRGPEQVIGVLGALLAGRAYLPIDSTQPATRRNLMLADAGVRDVLTQSWLLDDPDWPEQIRRHAIDEAAALVDPESQVASAATRPPATPDSIAYVIYTSGSTGAPKGVQITHRSALNTIEDMNARFGIGRSDAVLGLANLGFDLSVYDIFGVLGAGGRLVLPDHERRGDPTHWAQVVAENGVTVWNSVPAQMQMLTDYLESDAESAAAVGSLRLALLSGDWIPVTLPDRIRRQIPGITVISLGGATEAAIWSIWHPVGEVPDGARSVSYGKPLANQTFHVLDPWLRDCPDGVTGELYIGGVGLAAGYLGDPERTAARFIVHPRTGERLYRTGDLGRYLPDGEIEFLGREDTQVKIRGHRIELAEIEAALLAQPGVAEAAVVTDGTGPFDRKLVGFVAGGPRPAEALTADAAPRAELARVAERAGEEVVAGVDREGYVAYLRHLDVLALQSMLAAFREGGLFGPGEAHTSQEVQERMQTAPRNRRVVRRWLRALADNGLLSYDPATETYSSLISDSTDAATAVAAIAAGWDRADALQARFDPASAKVHDYFKASTGRLPEVLRSDGADAVQLLFPQGRTDVTESLYNVTLFNRWANQVLTAAICHLAADTAGDRTGPLRILEVGAGVGGTSRDVIPALAGYEVDYLFTDLSQFFLGAARTTFQAYPWVRYATFDVDTDYRAQGMAANSFDVILLGDVMHATHHVGRTLATLRELLAPGGWLLFAEMTRDHYQIMTSMELLLIDEGSAGDFADLRRGRDQTFVGHEDWLRLLARSGDELAFALPRDQDALSGTGLRVYAEQVKTDRVRLDPHRILDDAASRLPAAMVPGAVHVLDRLPLTANGKTDRERLSTLIPKTAQDPAGGGPGDGLGDGADELADELERRIARQWEEVLALPRVGRTLGFFEAGGDSLLATRLTTALLDHVPEAKPVDFAVLLRLILEGPSVLTLAAQLRPAP